MEDHIYRAAALFRERAKLEDELRRLDAQIEAERLSHAKATGTFGLTTLMFRKECEAAGVLTARVA